MEGNFIYRKGGENTFAPRKGETKPGPIGLNCIGGVIKHVAALTAIGSSTVNSYRRLWDTGFWAPVYADWGYQNRTCALRISAPGRFEYRSVDSTVNPYLMAAALLKAFDDGIRNKLDPGEPEERNIYAAMAAGKKVKKLPMSLGESLDALEKDEVIKSRDAGRDVPRFQSLQARRVGAVHGHRHRMGPGAVLGLPAVIDSRSLKHDVRHCRRDPYGQDRRHRPGDDLHAARDEASRAGFDRLRSVRHAESRRAGIALQSGRAGGNDQGLRHPPASEGARAPKSSAG